MSRFGQYSRRSLDAQFRPYQGILDTQPRLAETVHAQWLPQCGTGFATAMGGYSDMVFRVARGRPPPAARLPLAAWQ